MKREDIEKAAQEESGIWAPTPIHVQDIHRRDDFEAGFHSGVEWVMYKLWHSIEEVPERLGEFILFSNSYKCTALVVPVNNEEWNNYIKIFNPDHWLYVNDLREKEE